MRERRNRKPRSLTPVPAPRAGDRWHLHLAASSDAARTADFLVANGSLAAASEDTVPSRSALTIDWMAPKRIEWAVGEQAVLFELRVPRPARRHLRVRGPRGLAWALFRPGTDNGWRPRASAAATGVAGGVTYVDLSEAGVWALVVFQNTAITRAEPVEITFEPGADGDPAATSSFLAEAHELRRFVLASLALAVALALGEAGRTYLVTGNIWTTWGMVPIGIVFLLFPTSFTVTMLWHTFHSMRVLRGEEVRRIPTFANRPLDVDLATWPSVTIQIPVFREGFEDAIRPTLETALVAARRYSAQTGARCNVLVCEDGLLWFARNDLEGALAAARGTEPAERSSDQNELMARMAYYEASGIAFVARPYPEPGMPGTERAGRFRKASNLNYALRLADRLEGNAPLSAAHAKFRDAIPARVYELGRWQGDVSVGEIIVQLDKDSMIPPDVIRATVPEFLADPTLAYTQHASYPTNEGRYFSVVIGWFTRLLYDLSIRAKCLIPGTLTPLMGHNVFLRRADLFRVGAWYEHSVCEDLELLLRFHESGSHGKYVAYPGHDFGEAVTRVYTEELEKFRRYAFGAVEAVLNPVAEWEHRGVVKQSWRRFCRSEHVRWYQVVDLLQFFFSLVNLASLVPLAIVTGLGLVHPYRSASMLVMSLIVFGLVPIPAIFMLRRRGALAAMPAAGIWGSRFAPWKAVAAQFALSYTFLGYSLAVTRGVLGHLFSRPIVFAETNADDIGQASRGFHLSVPSMRHAMHDGLALLAISAALAVWRMYLNPAYGVGPGRLDWRFHFVWLYPLLVTAVAPWIFHPYLMGGRDLPRRRSRSTVGAGGAPVIVPAARDWIAAPPQGAA